MGSNCIKMYKRSISLLTSRMRFWINMCETEPFVNWKNVKQNTRDIRAEVLLQNGKFVYVPLQWSKEKRLTGKKVAFHSKPSQHISFWQPKFSSVPQWNFHSNWTSLEIFKRISCHTYAIYILNISLRYPRIQSIDLSWNDSTYEPENNQ